MPRRKIVFTGLGRDREAGGAGRRSATLDRNDAQTAMVEGLAIVVAYLLGSLSFAVIVSRAMGLPDPHSYGSGNPGATNVLRSGRKTAALLTLVGDAAKGWLAVWLAKRFGPAWGLGDAEVALVAVAVFLGHLFPVFFGFRGGKGVATAAGVLFALDWRLGAIVTAVWLLVALVSRYSSLGALSAAVAAPLVALWLHDGRFVPAVAAVTALALLLVWRHRTNIAKLMSGREGRIGDRKRQAGPPEAQGPAA
jgi:glycerol-3-phosphate acyltransferase PlsY